MAGTIISGVIFCIVAMVMLGIGVSQLKSKEPVGFYTGEKPPKVDQLSDVNSWNKKHGVMWIIYGICIIGSWICSAFIGGDSIRVPEDISVCGFDDVIMSKYLGLTTVCVPNYERGFLAIQALSDIIDGSGDFGNFKVGARVKWRKSIKEQ